MKAFNFSPLPRAYVRYEMLPSPSLSDRLKNGLQILLKELTRSPEPRVQQFWDREGRLYWQVQDPIDNRCLYFDSENEVRIWLEQRYLL